MIRIPPILLFIGCLQVSTRVFAQTISLSEKNTPLQKVFKHIEQQSGYVFFFDYAWLAKARPVTLVIKNIPLKTALDLVFSNQPLTWSIAGKNIVVQLKAVPAAKPGSLTEPPVKPSGINVHGHVMDSLAHPLAGASVSVIGGGGAVSTNENGDFTLVGVRENASIAITYVGYESKIIRLDGNDLLDVVLMQAGSQLDEVQLTAYGSTSKRLSTGDIATVGAEEIALSPVPTVLQSLQGRVPGLFIKQQTGQPDGGFAVLIRSQSTLTGSIPESPLYVVDGVAYPADGHLPMLGVSQQNSAAYPLRGGNALNYLDPALIESVNVLKGPDATAIYGSRGAYGVVIITTKKAKPGPLRLTIDTYSGITETGVTPKLLNTPQYLALRREAFTNDGLAPGPLDADINGVWDTTHYTNWQKVLQGAKSPITKSNIFYSAGSNNSSFLLGASYSEQGNVQANKGSVRIGGVNFSIRSATDDRKFSVTLSGSYTHNVDDMALYDASPSTAAGIINTSGTLTAPDAPPLYLPDGNLDWSAGTNPDPGVNIIYKNTTNNLVANGALVYAPVPGFSINLNAGYTLLSAKELRAEPSTYFNPGLVYPPPFVAPSVASLTMSELNLYSSSTVTLDPHVSYKHRLGAKGTLELTTGATLQSRMDEDTYIVGTGFVSDALLNDPANALNDDLTTSHTENPTRYLGFFGVAHYNWDNKYILNVNGRRDGSTKFSPDNQFGNFGSIGAAWILSEEKWFKHLRRVVDFVKLRGSWGIMGGDAIPNYSFLNTYYIGSNTYQGGAAAVAQYPANPALQWQQNKEAELGAVIDLFKGAVNLEATYYTTWASQMLAPTPLSSVTGFRQVTENSPARVRSTGLELTGRTKNIHNKIFSWETYVNITFPHSKLLSYPGGNAGINATFGPGFAIGRPITVVGLYKYDGVDPATGKYLFTNARRVTGPFIFPTILNVNEPNTDRTESIDLAPKFYGGIGNTLRYKQFTLDFFFTFTDRMALNYQGQQLLQPGVFNLNVPTEALKRWRKPGDKSKFPAATTGIDAFFSQSDFVYSTGAYSNATYARLANVNLSYHFTPHALQKSHLTAMDIYLAGQNLLTVTRFPDLDPENQGEGTIGPLRIFTGGFNISF